MRLPVEGGARPRLAAVVHAAVAPARAQVEADATVDRPAEREVELRVVAGRVEPGGARSLRLGEADPADADAELGPGRHRLVEGDPDAAKAQVAAGGAVGVVDAEVGAREVQVERCPRTEGRCAADAPGHAHLAREGGRCQEAEQREGEQTNKRWGAAHALPTRYGAHRCRIGPQPVYCNVAFEQPRGEGSRRMQCPFCQHAETRVIDSRLAHEGEQVRRRRECSGCGERFTTYESAIDLALPRRLRRTRRADRGCGARTPRASRPAPRAPRAVPPHGASRASRCRCPSRRRPGDPTRRSPPPSVARPRIVTEDRARAPAARRAGAATPRTPGDRRR